MVGNIPDLSIGGHAETLYRSGAAGGTDKEIAKRLATVNLCIPPDHASGLSRAQGCPLKMATIETLESEHVAFWRFNGVGAYAQTRDGLYQRAYE